MNKNKIVELLLNNGFEVDPCSEDFSVERYVWFRCKDTDVDDYKGYQEIYLTNKGNDFYELSIRNYSTEIDNMISYENGNLFLSSDNMASSIAKLENILSICSIYKYFEE